ncbi:MAG: hypothetical protein JXR84_20945 [Anaerolineae bacterium]|nr:hypothetical protein [Anaerolineae bacterium]
MTQETVTTPPAAKKRAAVPAALEKVRQFFRRIIKPFLESFFPKPHYLEDEVVQQVIRMANYRAEVPRLLGIAGIIILVPGLILLGAASLAQADAIQLVSAIMVIVALFFLFIAAQEWLNYNQWHFIVTNKRIILITPHPQRRGFADAIYLKGGKIQVLDTNFSKSPLWGLFQMIQGTRDVMLSMSGYEFLETGAQVKGGLRFPDVKPDDIRRLEELIFS